MDWQTWEASTGDPLPTILLLLLLLHPLHPLSTPIPSWPPPSPDLTNIILSLCHIWSFSGNLHQSAISSAKNHLIIIYQPTVMYKQSFNNHLLGNLSPYKEPLDNHLPINFAFQKRYLIIIYQTGFPYQERCKNHLQPFEFLLWWSNNLPLESISTSEREMRKGEQD